MVSAPLLVCTRIYLLTTSSSTAFSFTVSSLTCHLTWSLVWRVNYFRLPHSWQRLVRFVFNLSVDVLVLLLLLLSLQAAKGGFALDRQTIL